MGPSRTLTALLFAIGLACFAWAVAVKAEHQHPQHHQHDEHQGHQARVNQEAHQGHGGGHDHAAHQAMMQQRTYTRSIRAYDVPEVSLIDQHGREVLLPDLLQSPEPVALNFIFTTCTTICPVMTATFAHMRDTLGPDASGLRTVSISIDPEYDTPAVLKQYAARHGDAPDWLFLTGDAQRIVQVQKAFDAYTGSKVNHRPLTLFKGRGSQDWVRIDGLAGGSELAAEYQKLAVQ
jgi:protein SCO1/2